MLHFQMCNISYFRAWYVGPNSPDLMLFGVPFSNESITDEI